MHALVIMTKNLVSVNTNQIASHRCQKNLGLGHFLIQDFNKIKTKF